MVDGNMKNHCDICLATKAGYAEYKGLPGRVQTVVVVLGDRAVVEGRTVVVCRAVVEIGALMVGKVVVGDRTVERDSHMYTVGRRKQAKHNIYYFQLHGLLPSTFSIPMHMCVRATLVTEQLYIPESLSARLLISSSDFPGLLTILLPSLIRSALPSFSQRIFLATMPAKEHTSSK